MPSSFQASHMPNNQCIMVQGENNLPRQNSLAVTALSNITSFPSTKPTACALHPWSERVKQRRHGAHTRAQGRAAMMQAVLPRVTRGESFLSPFQQALPHQSPENALKMKSATYLLSILISREAVPFRTSKMIHTQKSSVLKEVISFQSW